MILRCWGSGFVSSQFGSSAGLRDRKLEIKLSGKLTCPSRLRIGASIHWLIDGIDVHEERPNAIVSLGVGKIRVDRAIWHQCAKFIKCPPSRIESMPRTDRVCPGAASAQETERPIRSTVHRPTALPASSASWQKLNEPPPSNVGTSSEAEPIYANSSYNAASLFGGLGINFILFKACVPAW